MAVADDEVRPSTAEEEAPGSAKKRRSSVLGALREAIGKVRFLLSFSATRWMLLASSAAGRRPARLLSFDARPGLLEVEGSIVAPSPASSTSSGSRTSRSSSLGTATARSLSRTSSAASPAAQVMRTSSLASGAGSPGPSPAAGYDDIDQRAQIFIDNFYRQLRMERQVSLQLRYVRGNSWDRTP